jgi:hypothetical protein
LLGTPWDALLGTPWDALLGTSWDALLGGFVCFVELLIVGYFKMNKVLPIDVNIYSSDFDFGVFLDINFDKYIENYPEILNSQELYLKYKNKYIFNQIG